MNTARNAAENWRCADGVYLQRKRDCPGVPGGKTLARVTFPALDAETVELDHTFVDDSLRGQGVAGKLLEAAAAELRKRGLKAVPTCSYAVKWFGKHPEFADVKKA